MVPMIAPLSIRSRGRRDVTQGTRQPPRHLRPPRPLLSPPTINLILTPTTSKMFQLTLHLLLSMLALVAAAPIEAQGHQNPWQYGVGGGVVGFIVLILDIIVFSLSPALFPEKEY